MWHSRAGRMLQKAGLFGQLLEERGSVHAGLPAAEAGSWSPPAVRFLDRLRVLSTSLTPEKFTKTTPLLLRGCFFRFVDQANTYLRCKAAHEAHLLKAVTSQAFLSTLCRHLWLHSQGCLWPQCLGSSPCSSVYWPQVLPSQDTSRIHVAST